MEAGPMTILASATAVLRCYGADCTSLSVTDLVVRLGMPKSNASRLLRAMRDAGLLETIGESKRYRPGLLLVDVGRAYMRSSSLIERADQVVRGVSAASGHTGYVTVRDGRHVTAVTDHPGSNTLRVASSIGRRLPAFASATGRSLLARLSDDAVRALYTGGLAPPSARSPQTVQELLELLAVIRRDGFATSSDEATRGVDAVAVAVADPASGEEVSLCIVCPTATTSQSERAGLAASLLEGAAGIAALTGDPQFPARRKAA
jgi:DNA-binding IclR family transcriptional regulator